MLTSKIKKFLDVEKPQTPCLIVDLNVVSKNYRRFKKAFPKSNIFYAVKANPAAPVLRRLVKIGSSFDVASVLEVEKCIAVGAEPKRISFGNTIKKLRDIAEAYRLGVRIFAFDSEEELEKIRIAAPGAKVICRVLTTNTGSNWPIADKFGCSSPMAIDLLLDAKKCGLEAYGLCFHVGSQQTHFCEWEKALRRITSIFGDLRQKGVHLSCLNLGGGFPIRYQNDIPDISELAVSIQNFLSREFGNQIPQIMFEPGRYIIGEAGIIRSEVVLISKKFYKTDNRWVYLDVGKFGGLAETMNEAIQYPLRTSKDNCKKGPVVIAGPTCDGVDVLYRNAGYQLPLTLKAGDHVDILCAGAYTASYATKDFNGFLTLQEHYL